MSKPIKIDFVSDTSKVIKGADNIADAFVDVADSLKDVAKGADRTNDTLTDGARDAAKAQGKIGDAMDANGKDARTLHQRVDAAFDGMVAASRESSRAVERNVRDGMEGASEGMDQMSGDAASNATEVAASFDGSADSIVEGMQGALAEMFSGFGPAGAAAGLAVALGLGTALAAMDKLKEENDAATEAVGSLAEEIYAAGGALDAAELEGKLRRIFEMGSEDNKWTFWTDESSTQLGNLKDGLGDVNDELARSTIKALAGSMEDGAKASAGLTKEIEALDQAIYAGTNTTVDGVTYYTDAAKAAQDRKNKLSELKEEISKATVVEAEATSQAEYYARVMGDSQEATEAATEAIEAKNDAEREEAGIFQDAMSAQMDYSDALAEATEAIATNGQAVDLNSAAGKANNRTLIELADAGNVQLAALQAQGAATDVLTEKTNGTRDAFVAQAVAAGYNKTEAEALAVSLGLIPPEVTTAIGQTGGAETKAAVEAIPAAKETTVTVQEKGTAETQASIDQVKDGDAEVKVKETGAAAVQATINGIKGRDVAVNLVIANERDFLARIDSLVRERTAYVTIQERAGVPKV